MQTVAGRLCVRLYEELGDAVLPIIREVYGAYGRELGCAFAAKWKIKTLEEAAKAFVALCNEQGLPSSYQLSGDRVCITGHKCPFGLDNTHRPVCEALMEMDREMLRTILGLSPDRLDMTIAKCLADGDSACTGSFRLLPAGEKP
jgi:predicted ArsR family transcriptional regulator